MEVTNLQEVPRDKSSQVEQISRGGTTFNWISTEANGPNKGYEIKQFSDMDRRDNEWANTSMAQGTPKTHIFLSGRRDLVWPLTGGRRAAIEGSVNFGFEITAKDPDLMPPVYQVAKKDFSGNPIRSDVVVKAVESKLGNLSGEILVIR